MTAHSCHASAGSRRSRPAFSPLSQAHPQSECFCAAVNDLKAGTSIRKRFILRSRSRTCRPICALPIPQHQQRRHRLPATRIRRLRRASRRPPTGLPAELRMPLVTTRHTVLREPRAGGGVGPQTTLAAVCARSFVAIFLQWLAACVPSSGYRPELAARGPQTETQENEHGSIGNGRLTRPDAGWNIPLHPISYFEKPASI
jgi:hypothetical protein